MAFCTFSEGAGMFDVTPIENMFLIEYLPTAPDGFLRVYLYARMLCLHPELGGGLDEMAATLHMDSDSVYNALSYWERQGLVERLTDRPPTYAILPVRSGPTGLAPMERDYYEYRDFNAALQGMFGSKKIIDPKDYEMAHDWVSMMGFTQDAVLKMVEDRVRRSKNPDPHRLFLKINENASEWAKRGVRTVEDVIQALEDDGKIKSTATKVLKQLSIHRPVTKDELKLVGQWVNEWNFSTEEILDACAETTKSRNPTLAYLNSILETRRKGESALFEGTKNVLRALGSTEVPTPDEQRRYGAMLARGFESQTILLAAEWCKHRHKVRLEDVEWTIDKWNELDLQRFEAANAYLRNFKQERTEVHALLEKCGFDRKPGLDDLVLYKKWSAAHSRELIDYAAECAHGMQLPMRYIDKLLTEWQKGGITSLEAARAQHAAFSADKGNTSAANPALNYKQHDYSEEDFSGIFLDVAKEYGEESPF